MVDIEHRVTVLETDVQTLKDNRVEDRVMLASIQKDIHTICLTLASGKGWIIGILGTGALLSTVINWGLRLMGH